MKGCKKNVKKRGISNFFLLLLCVNHVSTLIAVETMLKKFKTEELNLQRVIKKHFNALLVGFSPVSLNLLHGFCMVNPF